MAKSASAGGSLLKQDRVVEVDVRFTVFQVLHVDEVNAGFRATVFFEASWHYPTCISKDPGEIDWDTTWVPLLKVHNLVTALETDKWYEVKDRNEGHVALRYYLRGDFIHPYHLVDFPFDRQQPSFDLVSRRPTSEVFLKVSPEQPAEAVDPTGPLSESWKISSALEDSAYQTDPRRSGGAAPIRTSSSP